MDTNFKLTDKTIEENNGVASLTALYESNDYCILLQYNTLKSQKSYTECLKEKKFRKNDIGITISPMPFTNVRGLTLFINGNPYKENPQMSVQGMPYMPDDDYANLKDVKNTAKEFIQEECPKYFPHDAKYI